MLCCMPIGHYPNAPLNFSYFVQPFSTGFTSTLYRKLPFYHLFMGGKVLVSYGKCHNVSKFLQIEHCKSECFYRFGFLVAYQT